MDLHDVNAFTRRQFLHRGLTLASATLAVPAFLQRSALAMPGPTEALSSLAGVPEGNILVVIQLSGGNDGLNTVIPYAHDQYYRVRPGIGVRQQDAIALSQEQGIGLHPAMGPIKSLYDEGLCTIVQGVGYPNPNRSHFMSMDIWQTADTNGTGNGWLGRYIDSQCCGYGKGESGTPEGEEPRPAVQPPVAIGRVAPLALQGDNLQPISFESAELFRWTGEDIHAALAAAKERLSAREDHHHGNAEFLTRTALDARVSSDLIRKAVAARPLVRYPNSRLAQQLAMIASMIRAGMPTRVYYATLGGFDTHAGQGGAQGAHARLLTQLAEATSAFYSDLKRQDNADRVLTMSFSEFGRRVGQNGSGGTDHGTAAPMFLFGPMVRPGVHGAHPSLTDLDQGDLKFHTDFRSVYAAILAKWLKADVRTVLGRDFRPVDVIRS